ncbi:RING/U-box [Cyathus striatus]|nr:RING/U-box [Cyathus striatus]
MKVTVKQGDADSEEGDVCGICRVPYEGCCPSCKMPGDDCPLIWGQCTHVFHMHCLLKWLATTASKQQCPMDRRPWQTAERTAAGGSATRVEEDKTPPWSPGY